VLESVGSSLGLLLLAREGIPKQPESTEQSSEPNHQDRWLTVGALMTIAFCIVLGRGVVVAGHA
jgi:hypothetical protein